MYLGSNSKVNVIIYILFHILIVYTLNTKQTHCYIKMVYYNRFYGTTWNATRPVRNYQQWYQRPCCDSWKNKTHKTTLHTKTNYLQKEKGFATQKWPNNKRFISQEAKQLLKKKVEEVVSFNSSKLNQHITHTKRETGETSRPPKKERRARCFACRQRGHFF